MSRLFAKKLQKSSEMIHLRCGIYFYKLRTITLPCDQSGNAPDKQWCGNQNYKDYDHTDTVIDKHFLCFFFVLVLTRYDIRDTHCNRPYSCRCEEHIDHIRRILLKQIFHVVGNFFILIAQVLRIGISAYFALISSLYYPAVIMLVDDFKSMPKMRNCRIVLISASDADMMSVSVLVASYLLCDLGNVLVS